MPLTSFEQLPDDARVWVFGASQPVIGDVERAMLADVDAWLAQWQAHGHPLTCAREWRDGRFLAIGVDQSTAGASGCSIDALFRILQAVERATGTSLLGGGRIFYRDARGHVQCVDRATFAARMRDGEIGGGTPVFDTTLTTAEAYRSRFERPMQESWHMQLV
jgi:hypothetical protein